MYIIYHLGLFSSNFRIWGGVRGFWPPKPPPLSMGAPQNFTLIHPPWPPFLGVDETPIEGGCIPKIVHPPYLFWGVSGGFGLKMHPPFPFWGGIMGFLPLAGPPLKNPWATSLKSIKNSFLSVTFIYKYGNFMKSGGTPLFRVG